MFIFGREQTFLDPLQPPFNARIPFIVKELTK
jgi:hypothetical protein